MPRLIKPIRDKVSFVIKTSDPTVLDTNYAVPCFWINTSAGNTFIHYGSGVWKQIAAGTGTGTSWGTAVSVTIVDGVITLDGPGWYKIETQGAAASDNLDTINGLTEGEEALLSLENAAHDVVLRNGVGNLDIKINTTLNDLTDRFRVVHDGTNLVEASSRP